MFEYILYGSLPRYVPIFLLLSINLYGFDYHLKPYKISEGIHCFFGLPSQVTHSNGGNMVNSCYIETTEGYIVIDSGPTYSYAQDAYRLMEKKKKLPVKYVVNTSSDEVHILGNEFYKEQGAIVLGPEAYRSQLKVKKSLHLKTLLDKDVLAHTRIVPINRYISNEEILMLGNTKLHIKLAKGDNAHLYAYLKEKKIVFAGDMIFNNRIVSLKENRSLLLWEKELAKLEKLDWVDIVSAHGYMTRRSALNHTKTYLSRLKQEIYRAIKRGESKVKILKTVTLPSFSKDRLYSLWHKKNVLNAYKELKEVSAKGTKFTKNNLSQIKTSTVPNKREDKNINVSSNSTFQYRSFSEAIKYGKANKKIVLIKVRSTTCKYCDQLDNVISTNGQVRNILNQYFEVVKVNTDYETIPLNETVQSTPTLIFVNPSDQKVLMKLPGIRAIGELLEVLNEAVNDGHEGAYLKL